MDSSPIDIEIEISVSWRESIPPNATTMEAYSSHGLKRSFKNRRKHNMSSY